MLKATLTYLERGTPLVVATSMAQLDPEDTDFLSRHVQKLREAADGQEALFSRFQRGSGVPVLFSELLGAGDAELVTISAGLAERLQAGMEGVPNTSPGVLAVIASGPAGQATDVSVIKLDAITEAASILRAQGQVSLRVWKDLLPAPGQLQKGISWPDPRPASDTIVIDRNHEAAKYFFNAYELQISQIPKKVERALTVAIIKGVPPAERQQALAYAAGLNGPGDRVAAQVKERYASVNTEVKELGAGGLPAGNIRPGKLASNPVRYHGDGVTILVRPDRLDRVSQPAQVGDHWEVTVRFPTRPVVDTP